MRALCSACVALGLLVATAVPSHAVYVGGLYLPQKEKGVSPKPKPQAQPFHPENIVRANFLGPGGTEVKVYVGGLYLPQKTKLVIPGRGLSVDFAYNSTQSGLDFGYGYGWTHTLNMLWERRGADVLIRRGDGRKDLYAWTGSGYAPPTGIFDVLTEPVANQLQLRTRQGLIYRFFDPSHKRLTSIEDPNSNQITIAYSAGLPRLLTDASGRTIGFDFSSGHLTAVRDSSLNPPRVIQYQYDGLNRLIRVIDPLGYQEQYTYDARNNLIQEIDKRGTTYTITYNANDAVQHITSPLTDQSFSYDSGTLTTTVTEAFGVGTRQTQYEYDALGRLTHIVGNCCGYDVTFAYDASNNVVSRTDGLGHATTYTYDANGNRLSETDALTNTASWAYAPPFDRVTSATDRRGNTTTYSYDARGNLTQAAHPLAVTETWSYDVFGRLITHQNPNGHVTTYGYNVHGDVTSTARPIGTQTFTYDNSAHMLTATTAGGSTTTFLYDNNNNCTSQTSMLGETTTHVYDPHGNETATTNALGKTTSYAYDALDRRVSRTDPLGATTLWSYDQGGNLTQVIDPNGNPTSHTYTAQNLLASTTDAMGSTASYSYDAAGRRTSQVDFGGGTTTYTYDALDRLIQTQDPAGSIESYAYDPNDNLTGQTNGNGFTATYTYDALDRRIQTSGGWAFTLVESYDNDGNLIGVTDGNSQSTTYSYDGNGRKTSQVDPLAGTTTYTYDLDGNPSGIADPMGHTTSRAYDANGRITSETNPAVETTTYEYDAIGNLTKTTQPGANATTFTYDDAGRLTSTIDGIGPIGTYGYDAAGNRTIKTDPLGHSETTTYDALNRNIKRTDAAGFQRTAVYDANSRVINEVDENGHSTTRGYDGAGRLTSVTNGAGTTSYSYDDAGNVTSITDAKAHTTQYVYSPQNLLLLTTYADGTTTGYTYDPVGNRLSRVPASGPQTLYHYDAMNRVVGRDYSGINPHTYTYDADGRLISASNDYSTMNWSYDPAHRLLSETLNGRTTSYTYNATARTRTILYPGGRVIRENMDLRLRLGSIVEGAITHAAYSYDAANRLTSRQLRNNTMTTYGYTTNDRLVTLQHQRVSPPGTIAAFAYGFDPEGNRLFEAKNHQPTRSEAYQYDAIDRLIDHRLGTLSGSTIPAPINKTTVVYDPVANRQTMVRNAVSTIYSTNVVNEYTMIQSGGPPTFPIWDPNGNLQFDGVSMSYNHDPSNLLVNAGTSSYQYDALGRLIRRDSPSGTVKFFYDGDRVIEERNAADAVTLTYVYGSEIDDIISATGVAGTVYSHRNALGSTVAATDLAGNPVERYEYDAYGKPSFFNGAYSPISASAIGNRYLFTGREYEPSGLYYYRARHYDPVHGRFIERDPIGYVEGMNLYEYVHSNPMNFVDPSGLKAGDLTITVVQPAKKLTECGAAEYKVKWSVEGNVDGWVIQHVRWDAKVTDCLGNKKVPNNPDGLEYWEGWQVVAGSVYIGAKNARGNNLHNADTFRTVDEGEGTKGRVYVDGFVSFMAGYVLVEPPWGHTVPAAGDLPTRNDAPAGWWDLKLDRKFHNLTVRWACCKKERFCTVSSTP